MNSYSTLTVADKLSLTLEGLMRAVAACSDRRRPGGAMAVWLIRLIWMRVSKAHQRLQRLLAQFLAGRLRVVGGKREGAVAGRKQGVGSVKRKQAEGKVPRRLAWLLPLVPCDAANFASQLRILLAEPEMAALLAASPQARRVLAPLCRMLGIEAALLTPRPADPPAEVPRAAEGLARAGEPRPGNVPISDHLPSWISQVAWMERRAVGPPD